MMITNHDHHTTVTKHRFPSVPRPQAMDPRPAQVASALEVTLEGKIAATACVCCTVSVCYWDCTRIGRYRNRTTV
eukprot:2789870-Prymnesium_polylepis.1